jgi:predicted acyl esterase
MKKKSSSKLAFFSLRVLPSLVAAAFIASAVALSNSVGETSSCAPSGTAQWPAAPTPNPSPPLLSTDFYFEDLSTPHPVLLLRGCEAASTDFCSSPQPSLWPGDGTYHLVIQDIRGSSGCHNVVTPFFGDLLYKFDQDDGHATLAGIEGSGWSQLPGGSRIAMEGTSNGGVVSYLAAPHASPSLRGIQPHFATGDLLNYGLFNGGVQHKEIPYPVDLQWRLWRVADFDHDTIPDYVLYNPGTSETAVWYLMNVNSNPPSLGVRTVVSGPTITGWQLQAVDDFDHDSNPDYVLYDPITHATAIWYLRNDLTVREERGGPIINFGTAWQLVTVGDFDGDGNLDYVLYNTSNRATAVWYLNNNTFRDGRGGPTITAGWYLVGVDDFDHDGTPDYVLYNPTSRQTAVWYLINSNPITVRITAYGPTITAGWLPDAVDDFDHDGIPDYVLYAPSGQATAVWYLRSDLTVRTGAFGPTQSSEQISWKDYVGLGIWDKYLITDNDAGFTNVAGLHVGGWFDVFGQGILDTFSRLQKAVGPSKDRQKVVIGPWGHGVAVIGDGYLPFPSPTPSNPSLSDYDTKWKKGVFQDDWTEWNALPAVKVYLMNAPLGTEWRSYTTWPPPAQEKTFYFTTTTSPASLSSLPQATPGQLTFTSNPSDPCPTLGGTNNLTSCGETGGTCGPYDQRPIENDRTRRDFVVFTSGANPLLNGGPIVGRMYADVWIKTTALPDVDVFVRMTDVFPDGHSMLMAQGIQRARYRNGGACPVLPLDLTQPTKVRVDLGSTALQLGTGHKLRVIVSASAGGSRGSSLDPLYSVNPQNGNEYIGAPPNSTPTSGPINVLAGTGQASVLVIPVPTPGPTPPDRRPPKPTPCPN